MEVSTLKPFTIVYSLYSRQYLGYYIEPLAVQLDDHNKMMLCHQSISPTNAKEFEAKLDTNDYEAIELIDSMKPEVLTKKFCTSKKKLTPDEFILSTFDKEKGDKNLQKYILDYLETKRAKLLPFLRKKKIFESANDDPIHRTISYQEEKATVMFHVVRNADNTHYYPTIKHKGVKLEFPHKEAIIICSKPAWLILNGKLYEFEGDVDGNKLKPFIEKKFVVVPRKLDDTFYGKFLPQMIESFLVRADGVDIQTIKQKPKPVLSLTEFAVALMLFDAQEEQEVESQEQHENVNGAVAELTTTKPTIVLPKQEDDRIVFSLKFDYGTFLITNNQEEKKFHVETKKEGENYIFYKIERDIDLENSIYNKLKERGLELKNGKIALDKPKAFSWLSNNKEWLENEHIEMRQEIKEHNQKRFFLGSSTIEIIINENKDWFDVNAIVKFGEFHIPFQQLRKYIMSGRREFLLPNGETAVIPEEWFAQYADLFHFIDNEDKLRKYHFGLVQELQTGKLANVNFTEKLQLLKDFEQIDDSELSEGFRGLLRPYQKAGYNWLRFLSRYNFGGCLADDMGLGKTIQTLALLQYQRREFPYPTTSLLVMPTSLLYNWEKEAKKFTPTLRVLIYAGSNRKKDVKNFEKYDLVLTSYGITRIDIDLIKDFYFNYVILDESQNIKNPQSNIAKAVSQLKSRRRLVLTGTPVENTTMDLWSQMNFLNPGLLGTQNFFKDEYQIPIEKYADEKKKNKLHIITKPFILRRHKSQVAKELPEKVETIHYCTMSELQEKMYEEVKSTYRNQLMEMIEETGMKRSHFMILQGLMKLRQIANHPKLTDDSYKGDSGKLEDVMYALENALQGEHKILIFSQFVKHLEIVKEELTKKHIHFAYLDGATRDRQGEVDKFQKNTNIKVFLISLKAGGVGLNLTAADYVFLLDPWWNPAVEAQAIDRAYRIGQENKVFVYKFITRNSVEEKILALQNNKKKLATDLITTEESIVKQLTKNDIEALLS
ncbi:MAG: hypothetical protein OHK0038_14080 [Flammeovirgaceae bacterium]